MCIKINNFPVRGIPRVLAEIMGVAKQGVAGWACLIERKFILRLINAVAGGVDAMAPIRARGRG